MAKPSKPYSKLIGYLTILSILALKCFGQLYVADVVVYVNSLSSPFNMSTLSGTNMPCPRNKSFVWTSLAVEMIVFSSSSWCTTSGPSKHGTPPNVDFDSGLSRNCSLTSTDNLDFHVSISGLLSCDGERETLWPLCTDAAPIALDTRKRTDALVTELCYNSFSLNYSYTLKCQNPNSYPPTCTALCRPIQIGNVCISCSPNGTIICCPGYGGPNCTSGYTMLSTSTYASLTTISCPEGCSNVNPADALQQKYFAPMILCACLAGVLLILVIILCVVCYNHKAVIQMLRDYQNEARSSPAYEDYSESPPRNRQASRPKNPDYTRPANGQAEYRPVNGGHR